LQVARSSFAPRSAATILFIALHYGSSVQIRYFLPGSLSFEPLGTIAIMLSKRLTVNKKIAVSSTNNWPEMLELATLWRG
jgi:hypothetical protein